MQPQKHEATKTNTKNNRVLFVPSCLRGRTASWFRRARAASWCRGGIAVLISVVPLAAQPPGKPVTYKGLEMSVAGVERAPRASLKDCPPGGNTVNATTRPGEEFAVVSVNFKVLPAFQPNTMLKRPVVTDEAGKTYNTAVSFVDVGGTPEFSCAIPFRVPMGTRLKSIQIDSATLEIPADKP
jgi:hypothetical protein